MVAKRVDVFFIATFIFIIYSQLLVKKPCFIQPDGISITLFTTDVYADIKESFTYGSLFVYRTKNSSFKFSRKSTLFLLLLVCGDIETCPGPEPVNLKNFIKKKGISLFHHNIRGLQTNFTQFEILLQTHNNIDVMSLSETHITESAYNDIDSLYKIDGYEFVKRNRVSGKGGGVAMYIKSNIHFKRRYDLENNDLESIWVEIFIKHSKSLLVSSYYRPPEGSDYLLTNFNDIFDSDINNVSMLNKEVIIMGDFNVNYLEHNKNKDFKSIFTLYGFKQLIKKATRITQTSQTLIDIIVSNQPSYISETAVFATSISDHDMVGCIRKINTARFFPRTITCRNYKSYLPDNLIKDLQNVDWKPLYNIRNVNEALTFFNKILVSLADKHAPPIKKKVRGKPCPWMNENLKHKMNKRDQLLRRARKTNNTEDWESYKQLRNKCTIQMRNEKSKYQRNLIQESSLNPKNFWRTVKSIIPMKAKAISVDTLNEKESNKKSTANQFCSYFSNIANLMKTKAIPLTDFVWRKSYFIFPRTIKKFRFQYISKIFVEKELKRLKKNKASGLDQLPPTILRDAATEISTPITFILNLSITTNTVPKIWKIARILPIHKSGDITLPENYRPISILPVLSKLLERSVHTQLLDFLEKNFLLNDWQFGYRQKRSTKTAATLLTDNIRREVDSGRLGGAVFIDLSKAFDTISHSVLLNKLQSYGIDGNELEWLTDYLFERKQIVDIQNAYSDEKPLLTGVPQGSILGPLLFIIFLNDLAETLNHSKIIKYADDTVVYFSEKNVEIIQEKLNEDLENISRYFSKNELIINLKKGKTESMLFGTAKRLSNQELELLYKGMKINFVRFYKYLGSIIDNTLTFERNFYSSYKKASGRLRFLANLRPCLTGNFFRDAVVKICFILKINDFIKC